MNNKVESDKLKDIFAKVKQDSPSMSFENNLMQRVRAEHLIAERTKSRVALLSLILGVLGVIIIPSVALHFLGWSIIDIFRSSEVSFLDVLCSFNIDSTTMSISLVCLLLLMADNLIRRHINKKERE